MSLPLNNSIEAYKISVNNPFGVLLVNGLKKVENRNWPIDKKYTKPNVWLAVQIVKKPSKNQNKWVKYAMKHNMKELKMLFPDNCDNDKDLEHMLCPIEQIQQIIGFIQVLRCVKSEKNKSSYDPIWGNYPEYFNYQWIISNFIKLHKSDYMKIAGQQKISAIASNIKNKCIKLIVQELTQRSNIHFKPNDLGILYLRNHFYFKDIKLAISLLASKENTGTININDHTINKIESLLKKFVYL